MPQHLPSLLNVDLSLACWNPPTPAVIFNLVMPLFKLLLQLNTISYTRFYLHILAKAFQVFMLAGAGEYADCPSAEE